MPLKPNVSVMISLFHPHSVQMFTGDNKLSDSFNVGYTADHAYSSFSCLY